MISNESVHHLDLSRRRLLRNSVLVAGVAVAGAMTAGAAIAGTKKMSQQAAAYQPTAKGQQRCNNCTQWQPPAGCATVEGQIAASGWCNLYVAKP